MTTFKQINPGPRPADEPNGASDILAFYNLRRLHDLTQSGTFVAQQQEQARAQLLQLQQREQQQQAAAGATSIGIPGDARLWKRGAATGLSPLASKPAPSVPAGSRPALAVAPLARSLAALERGPWSLGDGARGELVAEGAGEESAAAVLLLASSAKRKEGGGGRDVAGAGADAAPAQPPPSASAAVAAAAAGAPSPARPAVAGGGSKIKIKVKLGPKK